MKLVHPDWEKQIELKGEGVPLISIEDPATLYGALSEMKKEGSLGVGRFVLSEGEKILDMRKRFLLILHPWDMDMNDRKIITKLVSQMAGTAQGEQFFQKTGRLGNELVSWMEEVTSEIPLPIAYDLDIDWEGLIKSFHIHLDDGGLMLEERMISFMKIWSHFCGETAFCFYGFRNLLPAERRELFYENAKEEELQFFLLEGPVHDIIQKEDAFIIDKDLCQIF